MGEIYGNNTGARLTHVPYKGSSPMHTDLLGGTIKVAMTAIANSNEDIAAWVKTMEKNVKFSVIELGGVTAVGTGYTFSMTANYTSK